MAHKRKIKSEQKAKKHKIVIENHLKKIKDLIKELKAQVVEAQDLIEALEWQLSK